MARISVISRISYIKLLSTEKKKYEETGKLYYGTTKGKEPLWRGFLTDP